jgi:hypothetical protein
MRLKHVLLSLAALGMGAALLQAAPIPVSLNPTADNSVLADGANTNYNSSTYLYLQGSSTAVRRSLLRFDLTPYAGKSVDGNATLQLKVDLNPSNSSQKIELYSIVSSNAAWGETSATWNNLLKSSLTTDTTDSDKPWVNAAGTGSYPGLGAPGESYAAVPIATATAPAVGSSFTFTIPASVLQNWIDHPSDNAGLLLRLSVENDSNSNNRVSLYPREVGSTYGPILKFTVVPEPATGALILIGGGLLTLRRRK